MDLQLTGRNLGFANYADEINQALFNKIKKTYSELDIADAQVLHDFEDGVPAQDVIDTLVERFEDAQAESEHHNHMFN
jgi:hypothetical protein